MIYYSEVVIVTMKELISEISYVTVINQPDCSWALNFWPIFKW